MTLPICGALNWIRNLLIKRYQFATYRDKAAARKHQVDRYHCRSRYLWQHKGKYEELGR